MKFLPFRPPSLIGPRVRPPSEDSPTPRQPSRDSEPTSSAKKPRAANNSPIPIFRRLTSQRRPVFESEDAVATDLAPPEGAVSVLDRTSDEAADVADVAPVTPLRGSQVDNVVPFRRRRAVRRLRRHPLVRWLQPFALAVAIVAFPVAIAAWFWSSPRFALAEVFTTSGERVSESWVQKRLEPFLGHNLLLLPLEKVQKSLKQHPWAASISLRKELPGRLHIRIEERQEVALLRRGSELLYVDSVGYPITPFEPNGEEVDLVILSQRNENENPAFALEFLRELEEAKVTWLAGLSEIRVLGQKDFKIFTTNLPFPLLVRGGTVEHKARRLETLLPQIVARYGSGVEVDLRFARRIIVQPGPRVVDARKLSAAPRMGVS